MVSIPSLGCRTFLRHRFSYLSAGLFWSLEWRDGRGVHFGFTESTWPHQPKAAGFTKIMWYALPFMALAAAVFIPFLI